MSSRTTVVLGSVGIAAALLLFHYSQTRGPMVPVTLRGFNARMAVGDEIGQLVNAIDHGNGALRNGIDSLITGYFPGNSPDAAAEEMQCRAQTLSAYGSAHSEYGHGQCAFKSIHPLDSAAC